MNRNSLLAQLSHIERLIAQDDIRIDSYKGDMQYAWFRRSGNVPFMDRLQAELEAIKQSRSLREARRQEILKELEQP